MHRACFKLAEEYEDLVEDWYFNDQDSDLMDLVCRKNYLKGIDQKCLDEIYFPKGDNGKKDESSKPKKKKSKKNKKGDREETDIVPPAAEAAQEKKDEL